MASEGFKFLYREWREIEPPAWLEHWAARYEGFDNPEYFDLIQKEGQLAATDYELIGKWKEGCLKASGRWKSGTPAAYDVWMEAVDEQPTCPPQDGVAPFLGDWAARIFLAGQRNRCPLHQSFGLSRATTLLHFISAAGYPILDSRVATGMARLGCPTSQTVEGYLSSFCPEFLRLASLCGASGTDGLRKLDNALFSYGALTSFPTSLPSSG